MMHLRRIGMINWHLMPAMDIDVRGDIGVIGENRSGKSTLLDLIQVVMTGNSGRHRKLNSSAGDSGRRRSQRSVHAYCLGRLGPDDVRRQESITTIYLVFQDTETGKTVSIGIAFEAVLSESSERTLAQFIADGPMLSVDDFCNADGEGGRQPRRWETARPLLEAKCRQQGGELHVFRDEPTKFVTDYMRLLSTGRRFVAIDQFLKAFSNALSFDQIDSATDFVRRFLLEERPLKIAQLRDSIATYRELQKTIKAAYDKLERLKTIRALVESFHFKRKGAFAQQWLAARAGMDAGFRENRRLRRVCDTELELQRRDQAELDNYEALKDGLKADLEKVITAIALQGDGRRQLLDSEERAARAQRQEGLKTLQTLHSEISNACAVIRAQALLPEAATPAVGFARALSAAAGNAAVPAWPQDVGRLTILLDDARLDTDSMGQVIDGELERKMMKHGRLDEEKKDLQHQLAGITDRGFSLGRNVEFLLGELGSRGWRPRVLCTLLHVVDENWRPAAEGLLGRDREAIIVDDAHVEDAIGYLQQNRGRFRGCRIVNTRKLERQALTPQPGTLAAVLRSDDAIAMNFVIRRIGNVRLASSAADLHRPGRAIMRDGTYDDGLTVEMRGVDHDLIGADAGRRHQSALQARLFALEDDGAALREDIKFLKLSRGAVESMGKIQGRGSLLADSSDGVRKAEEELRRIDDDRARLLQGEDPVLRKRKEEIEKEMNRHDAEAGDIRARLVNSRREVGNATMALGGGDQTHGSALNLRWLKRAYRRQHGNIARSEARTVYENARSRFGGDLGRVAIEASQAAQKADGELLVLKGSVFDAYVAYHTAFGLAPSLIREEADVITDIKPWVDGGIERIEEVELVGWLDRATEAAEKTRNIFQYAFAFELRERIDNLYKAMDSMNAILRRHHFHSETYRFTNRSAAPYDEIVTLVEASRDDGAIFAHLFDDAVDDSRPHARALRVVQELLLDAGRDISDFEDYRRYFTFNLVMKDLETGREVDLESRRGTGSGAEQQVPFYVAIGTALAVAYHGRQVREDGEPNGIGLAVFDEAFSKLDGKNQKACMDFYEKLGLQVVVAAPFEKRATLYETMESFIETIRSGDEIEIEAYEVRERAQRAFLEANPAHIDMDELRAFVTARAGTSV